MSRTLRLAWRPFAFRLARPLRTARGVLEERRGWLLRLESADGALGWGEAAPLEGDARRLRPWIEALKSRAPRALLERAIGDLPPALAFALGGALAELDGLVGGDPGGWLPAPPAALLLPAGTAALAGLECWLASGVPASPVPPTLKWKVAAAADAEERRLLEALLDRLPAGWRLRLDANGGWDRPTAAAWADRLAGDGRLEWLEQPLDPADGEGLEALAARVPVALDESLALDPRLRYRWTGWQVRRPSQEGDPRPLLAALRGRASRRLMVSTGFETGLGRRWVDHLAALQLLGPTPTAPGLAPGWTATADGGEPLHDRDALRVWGAARGPGGDQDGVWPLPG